MTHSELNKGLILTFGALPDRIKKLEKYSQSHVKNRALKYIESSMKYGVVPIMPQDEENKEES